MILLSVPHANNLFEQSTTVVAVAPANLAESSLGLMYFYGSHMIALLRLLGSYIIIFSLGLPSLLMDSTRT